MLLTPFWPTGASVLLESDLQLCGREETSAAREQLQSIFERDKQDRIALLERYQSDPHAQSVIGHAIAGAESGSRTCGQRLLRRKAASEGLVHSDVIERALSGAGWTAHFVIPCTAFVVTL